MPTTLSSCLFLDVPCGERRGVIAPHALLRSHLRSRLGSALVLDIGNAVAEHGQNAGHLDRLAVDQPEENLDPKSVFDELVPLLIAAKAKRQVIIVSHNANLVVNTDADQIIVAQADPPPSGDLPKVSYRAGGLESASIRQAVCNLLEGGEAAFRERARRLRVRLDR